MRLLLPLLVVVALLVAFARWFSSLSEPEPAAEVAPPRPESAQVAPAKAAPDPVRPIVLPRRPLPGGKAVSGVIPGYGMGVVVPQTDGKRFKDDSGTVEVAPSERVPHGGVKTTEHPIESPGTDGRKNGSY